MKALRVAAIVGLAACGAQASPVEIVGACGSTTDAVRLGPSVPGMSIGILDGQVLLIWPVNASPTANRWFAQWFDGDLIPTTAPIELGTAIMWYPQLVRDGNALVGQLWVDPSGADPPLPAGRSAAIWRFAPGSSPMRLPPPALPIFLGVPPACPACDAAPLFIGSAGTPTGNTGMAPITRAGSSVVAATGAIPAACSDGFVNQSRLLLFGPASAGIALWDADMCGSIPPDHEVTDPWIVGLPSGDLGVFFRVGEGRYLPTDSNLGLVHYMRARNQ